MGVSTMGVMIKELIPETNPEDVELLVPAYLAIWNHPDNLQFLSFTGRRFEEAQLRDWCSRHVVAGVRYFCAFEGEQDIIGILVTRESPLEGFELFSVGVFPDQHRHGVGTSLIKHGLSVASSGGFQAVDGQVYATNAPMLCLLLNQDFVPVRIEHHRGPRGEDLVHLKKYL